MIEYDVIIIGAGASGLICGIEAGKRNRKALIIEHTSKIAEKIRISGGGKCNFTNLNIGSENYICSNKHFCKSALSQYTNQDFISLLQKYKIKFHEKTLGQVFTDNSAQEIIDMLLTETAKSGTKIYKETAVTQIEKQDDFYVVLTNKDTYKCQSLVIATGGLSIPKIGATDFGYKVAKQFGLKIIEPQPALVPLTFPQGFSDLSGISVESEVSCNNKTFKENILFTHKGLSGPAILQISSYWDKNSPITINLTPNINVYEFLKDKKQTNPKQSINNALAEILPKRLAQHLSSDCTIADASNNIIKEIAKNINNWEIIPTGTEGYKIAEVTRGGVDTDDFSSKTLECKSHKGLFFIGEVLDVTGQLGGYNLQWAWSSGYVAGQNV